jgi:hypothetical protein
MGSTDSICLKTGNKDDSVGLSKPRLSEDGAHTHIVPIRRTKTQSMKRKAIRTSCSLVLPSTFAPQPALMVC